MEEVEYIEIKDTEYLYIFLEENTNWIRSVVCRTEEEAVINLKYSNESKMNGKIIKIKNPFFI